MGKDAMWSDAIGYPYGMGGTVEQATSRTTAVELNKLIGQVTLVSAAGSTTPSKFTVNNNKVGADDAVIAWQKSGTDIRYVNVVRVADGAFDIMTSTASGTTTEQPVIGFMVLKGDIA